MEEPREFIVMRACPDGIEEEQTQRPAPPYEQFISSEETNRGAGLGWLGGMPDDRPPQKGAQIGAVETGSVLNAVNHKDEILASFVTKEREKARHFKFMKKALKRHGSPETITTERLR